jgi:hypothetical protein
LTTRRICVNFRGVTTPNSPLREFIYLDFPRVRSLAAQLNVSDPSGGGDSTDRVARERLFLQVEPVLVEGTGAGGRAAERIGPDFDFSRWKPETFTDGQFVVAGGTLRLMDYSWLAMALTGLPAVLRKMSKIEMAALRNSDEGRRMSKSQLQQRSLENQNAIAKVEEFKMEELSDVVRQLYGDVVRVKLRPSAEQPAAVLIGSARSDYFYDSPAATSQKYGIEIDAGWTTVGQLNVPNLAAPPQPIPVGNQMEDAFEQMALLMNNAFRLANAPAFPALSLTPIAIYRTAGGGKANAE